MKKNAIAAIIAGLVLGGVHAQPVPVNPNAAKGSSGLTGAGSTFVYPMMSKWAAVYRDKTKIQVNYQSIGSGGGIKQFASKTVDFGATDGPMNEEEIKEAGGDVLHIPVIMGGVAVTYNLPGVQKPLQFSGPTIAGIFQGKVTRWNDPAIAADNAGVNLPAGDIVVVHRSDGSGTTYIFSEYLSKVSEDWKKTVGTGKSLNWPVGIGGKGNEGVAAQVSRTPNAIGYVEAIYAVQNKMPAANVKNKSGRFTAPSIEAVTAAAGDLKDAPEDLRMSITDAAGEESYPVSGIVWLLGRTKNDNASKAAALRAFISWVLSEEGQALSGPLQYSRLPDALLVKARAKAAQIK